MALNPGANLNATPAAQKQTLASAYIDFTSTATAGWAQQYLPDLMEGESEVFGNRTIAGFLEKVGAEESMSADQVVWSEQGRLHLSYKANTAENVVSIAKDVDGNVVTATHGIRVGDTVLVSDASATVKCYVSVVSGADVTCLPYTAASLNAAGIADSASGESVSIFVYGSEFTKGTPGRANANEPGFKSYTNKPIIMKDLYEVSGSDASAIGWVEVSGEEGQNGYLWYLKAEGDTRARFTDYLEMTMLEAETAHEDAGAIGGTDGGALQDGTQGLFQAITTRGHQTTGVTGVNAATDLAEFDAILAEFDKQGAIEENMMFVNRATSLAMDDMLASMNSYGAGGTSYGVFNNSEDMALNLGFSGFRRGSYDFYKSDWKYLNDSATRGVVADTNANRTAGVIVPAGTSSVYDQAMGKNIRRPFLHVRYRAAGMEDRRFKTWTTGSVGAATSDLDAMEMHFLSERCLVTQGANNFCLLKSN